MFKTVMLTVAALLAFAGNSVLCRLALKDGLIDAASFTSIRLLSGVIVLLLLLALKNKHVVTLDRGSWRSGFSLFVYAAAFSFAYISLDTGSGALILFGSVQLSMIVVELLKGRRLVGAEWAGLVLALSGLCVLLLPGAAAPSVSGFVLMGLAGIAWAHYTLAGRGSNSPLADTANNFLRSLPFVVVLLLFSFGNTAMSSQGVLLAVVSGAVTSGLGYAVWYSALPSLTVSQAAVIQLTVPIIAAAGGILFAAESVSVNFMISSVLVLGGVLLVILSKTRSGPVALKN